jgi:ribonuclease HI
MLFTFKDHYFTSKANMGIGTGNQGEFKALFFLLKCALEKNILQLQVFGDSAMTINWMNNEMQVQSIGLSQLALHLKDISSLFHMISFTYIFRELNNFV